MSYTNPTGLQFQQYFQRDFPYTNDSVTLTGVNNLDINNALIIMSYNINQKLFPDQTSYTVGALYLAGHYLVLAIRQGTQGITGNWPWLESSKSVGPASQGFNIPQRILDNYKLSFLSKTYYGMLYLDFISQYLNGAAMVLPGRTNP